MKESRIRECIIFSKIESIEQLLTELKELNRRVQEDELKKYSILKGGGLATTKKDLKVLGLVKNGFGVEINEDGLRFLQNKDREYRKRIFLRVQFFREMYEEKIDTFNKALAFLSHKTKEYYKNAEGVSRMVARRYMEFVFGVSVGQRRKKKFQTKIPNNKNKERINNKYNFLLEELSEEELKKVVKFLIMNDNSPINEQKKEKLLEKLM